MTIFGEQWTTESSPVRGAAPAESLTLLYSHRLSLAMAKNPRFLRALQCFADAARKINPNLRPKPTIQDVPSVLTSLPEHKSLLPLLLSYNIPPKLAQACSDRYDEYASQLKSETESKLAPYLANKKESRPAQVYSLFLDRYSQVLRCWSQSVLDTALVNLKRDPVLELQNLEVTHLAPFWLPVRLLCAGFLVSC